MITGKFGTTEYILTKRHNNIISRKIYKYSWSIEATLKRKKYHETKNGKTYLLLPIKHEKLNKDELFASRRFSNYHYSLINNAYSQESPSLRIFKNMLIEQKHNIDLENINERLNTYKSTLKLKNPKNSMYKMVIYRINTKQQVNTIDTTYVNSIPTVDYLANFNNELSNYEWYHHLTITDSRNNVLTLFVNNKRY